MARIQAQGLWKTSLLGRLVRLAFLTWDHSTVGRIASAVARVFSRVFAGSFFGKVWYSQWPTPAQAEQSCVARQVAAAAGCFTRVGRRFGPVVEGTWQTSILAGLCRRAADVVGTVGGTSQIFLTLTGYRADVPLSKDEAAHRPTSPVVPLLGVLLGLLPLIPTNARIGGLPVPSPTMLMMAGVWAAALVWLARKLMLGDHSWRGSAAILPFAVFLMIAVAATVQSVSPRASLPSLLIWLTAALLFWIILNLVRNVRDAAHLLGPVLVGASLMTAWAVYQVFFPPLIEENWVDPTTSGELVRVFASLGNPNYLAEYMALYLPLGIALWIHIPRRRLELAIPVGLMALGLVLTYSRGGYLAAVAALGLLVLLRGGRWSIFLLLGAAAMALAAPQSVVNRLGTAWADLQRLVESLTSGTALVLADTSNMYRLNLWVGVRDMLAKFGMLGAGLGAEAFSKVYLEFMLPEARAAHAHNTYLQMLAETGIFGFVAILWTLLAVVRRTFVTGANPRSAFMIAAVAASLCGLLVHSFVEHIWYNPKLLFAFWAVAGVGLGLALGDREDARA